MIRNCLLFVSLIAPSSGQGRDPVSVGYLHKFNADIDNGAEVSIDRYSLNIGLPIFKKNDSFAAISATYTLDDYHFSNGYSPWGKISSYSVGVPFRWKLNDKWNWTSVLRFGVSLEQGASVSDSFTWGTVTSIDYRFNENLVIGPGFSYFKKLEDYDSIFPILSVRWDISDKWKLSTGPSEGANSGANISLKYDACDKWDFIAGLYYQNNRFRLASSNTSATSGVGEESISAIYGVAKYHASKALSYSLIGGVSFGNEYNLFDTNGETINAIDGDTAPFAGLRINYEF